MSSDDNLDQDKISKSIDTSKSEDKPAITTNSKPHVAIGRQASKTSSLTTPHVSSGATSVSKKIFLGILVVAVSAASGWGGAYMYSSGSHLGTDIVKQKEVILQNDNIVSSIAKKVGPSVVSIVTKQTQQSVFGGISVAEGAGTGVILSEDGLVLTNKHVVPRGVSSVSVISSDGTRNDAEVLARDPLNDIAFVKIKNAKNLKVAELGSSSNVRVGDSVVAIGNALGQFQNTVTTGIISGIGRPVTAQGEDGRSTESLSNLFQTDAAINPGNSGGPLVDMNGRIIGINTAVAGDAQNIGFSIPINDVKASIDSVKQNGRVVRPYLGVMYVPLTPDVAKQLDLSVSKGAYIGDGSNRQAVTSGGPAAKAGIRNGDIILKVESDEIDSRNSLGSLISKYKVGDEVELTVLRANKQIKITVRLAAAPDNTN